MKSTIIALLITLAAAALIVAAVRIGQDRADLRDQITTLERQIAHQQTMLDDARFVVEHLQREIACIETDMSPREKARGMSERTVIRCWDPIQAHSVAGC